MIVSQTAARLGISNLPSDEVIARLKYTCIHLELLRELTGHIVLISSGFRSRELNLAIGGSVDSQHMTGEAADIICPGYGTAFELAKLVKANIINLRVDQLIYEYKAWVHVSFTKNPRHQVFTITKRSDGYKAGLFT